MIFVVAGCRSSNEAARQQNAASQSSVPRLPDISALAPEIQQQIRNDYAALTAIDRDASRSASDRGEAYGSMGRRLLAVDYSEAAQPFLEKAQSLMPSDMRWPYYLGHAYRRGQDRAKAAMFTTVITLVLVLTSYVIIRFTIDVASEGTGTDITLATLLA